MRTYRFILSKQALIVFLVFFVGAGALLGVPATNPILADDHPPLLQAVSSGTWSLLTGSPSTPPARAFHAMATTPLGDMLLFGGYNGISTFFNDTWLFDTSTNSWSRVSTSPTPSARNGLAMANTPSGVLLFGGYNGSGYLNDTWLFNTTTNSWSLLTGSSSTPSARHGPAMATTPSGNVLLFGGKGSGFCNDTWLFNTATNSWSEVFTSPAPPDRYGHAMAATPSGVLLFGGSGSSGYRNDTWLFNTATNTWGQIPVSSPPSARYAPAMAATLSGDVLLFGGHDGISFLNDTLFFNTATNSWSLLTGSASTPFARDGLAMATTPSGVLLFGGYNGSPLNDTWLYGPVSSTLHLLTGWNLASIPAVTDGSPNTVFAGLPAGWALYSWDGVNSRYTSKVDTVLHVGTGFWLYVTGAIDYDVAGTPYTPNSLTIALANGWNIVGVPYPVNINWAAVQFLYGGNTYGLDQAITNGWMGAGVFNWTGTGYGNAAGDNFEPGKGYWLRANRRGCSLVFPKP